MNIRKNKKLLTASLLGATVLTVAGIGFSAWIVGLNRTSVPLENIPVTIDNVSEQTQFLNMVLAKDEGIKIADNSEKAADSIGSGVGSDAEDADLSLKFTTFDFTFPKEGATFGGLTFTPTINNAPLTVDAETGDLFERTAEQSYTYLELKGYDAKYDLNGAETEFTLDNSNPSYNLYKKTDLTLNFTRGSYFNYVSPVDFYQDKIKATESSTEKLKLMDACKEELNDMVNFFTDKTINIKAELKINFAN